MTRIVAVFVVASACTHAPSSQTGPVCGSLHCKTDEVCDRTDPAGPTCIPADGDLDGDGIPNSVDLCDHVAGGMWDEDGDGLGDECDPCPIAPPPATPDADGDAVDRPCDPDPNTPGDVIVAFSGFHDLPAGWTPSTPSAWQIADGDLVVTPPDATTQQVLTIPIARMSSYLAVLSAWRYDGAIAGAPSENIAIAAIDRRPAGVAQMHCGTLHDATGDRLQLDTDSSTASQAMPLLFDTTNVYRAASYIDGANVGCALITLTAQGAVQGAISPDEMSEADLVVQGANARFEYALVIARVSPTAP